MSSTKAKEELAVQIVLELSKLIDINSTIPENLSKADVQVHLQSLDVNKNITPEFIFDVITPYLFLTSADIHDEVSHLKSRDLSSHEALSLLTILATFNPNKYLKSASRSMHKFIQTISQGNKKNSIINPSAELISVITLQFVGDDVEVTANASKSIVALCKIFPTSLPPLFIPAIAEIWQKAIDATHSMEISRNTTQDRNKLSTIRVRCANTIVEIAILSNEGMDVFISSGASDFFLQMLEDSSDPLVQISAMDLLEQMAHIVTNSISSFTLSNSSSETLTSIPDMSLHRGRISWLFSNAVLSFLLEMAGGSNDDSIETDPFLGGQALKIISFLCPLVQYDNEIASSLGSENLLHQFTKALYNYEYSLDETSRIIFIDAVSSFAASSVEAFDVVIQDEVLRERWLSLSVSKPKIKCVVLLSVARLLDPSSFSHNNDQSSIHQESKQSAQSCVRLYKLIGEVNDNNNDVDSTTTILLSLAKSPLPEVRIASYTLMKTLVKIGKIIGVRLLLNNAGTFEFLINRELETVKEGKEAKYDIIKAIMKTEGIKNMMEDVVVGAFEKVLKQGPYFVPPKRWDYDLK